MEQIIFKVRDFIKMNADIDVYDDVCAELAVAFCGPQRLTEKGEKHFAEVLDYDITVDLSGSLKTAEVHVGDDDKKVWKRKFKKASEFFYALAGFCSSDDYDKWFVDPGYGQYATDPDANMTMTVYCDTTPWFSYAEIEYKYDNMVDLTFPRKMVQDYYINCGGDILNFDTWVNDEYTCDDTDGLFAWCENHGFIAVPED